MKMKKFASMILALVMILALAVPSMAADFTYKGEGNNTTSVPVNATYAAGAEGTNGGTVYSVEISWTNSLKYTAPAAGTYKWNTTSLKYELNQTSTEGTWTGEIKITVVNKSNIGVDVSASWENASSFTTNLTYSEGTDKLTVKSAALNSSNAAIPYTDTSTTGTAANGTITGNVTAGTITSESTSVGSITLTISGQIT